MEGKQVSHKERDKHHTLGTDPGALYHTGLDSPGGSQAAQCDKYSVRLGYMPTIRGCYQCFLSPEGCELEANKLMHIADGVIKNNTRGIARHVRLHRWMRSTQEVSE